MLLGRSGGEELDIGMSNRINSNSHEITPEDSAGEPERRDF